MKEERMRILGLLESGKIDAKEAALLLDALEGGFPDLDGEPLAASSESYKKPRKIRIEIEDKDGKSQRIKLPLGAAGILGKFLSQDDIEELRKFGVNIDSFVDAARGGAEGTIADIQDKDGASIRISIK
jgi:hypothetical protein